MHGRLAGPSSILVAHLGILFQQADWQTSSYNSAERPTSSLGQKVFYLLDSLDNGTETNKTSSHDPGKVLVYSQSPCILSQSKLLQPTRPRSSSKSKTRFNACHGISASHEPSSVSTSQENLRKDLCPFWNDSRSQRTFKRSFPLDQAHELTPLSRQMVSGN